MNYEQQEMKLRVIFEQAVKALAYFIYAGLERQMEPIRLARASKALLLAGCSTKGSYPWGDVAGSLLKNQRIDGGWADVEETLWCLSYLSHFGPTYEQERIDGKKWLSSVRLPCEAWGKSSRDQPRIPITSLTSILLPDVVDRNTLSWLAHQWEADLSGPTPLTYKGAFYLLSTSHCQADSNGKLVEDTIVFLENEQNEDGGFGPWRKHPIESCPWTTGVVLWGLSKAASKVSSSTLKRATSWLESKQLSNGLWPYHYLDDATSMALIGLSNILPLIIKRS